MKIKPLLPALLLTLAGCASSSPCVPPLPVAKVQTEAPGYFLTEWTKSLTLFEEKLGSLSKDANDSTPTP